MKPFIKNSNYSTDHGGLLCFSCKIYEGLFVPIFKSHAVFVKFTEKRKG